MIRERRAISVTEEHPDTYQQELAFVCMEEHGIEISQPIVSRLKEWNLSRRKYPRGGPRNEYLRSQWQADMVETEAHQLVFIDESLSKDVTGWRSMAAPIGNPVRYGDAVRGISYSVLPALTINGYLSCTGIRKGYYSGGEFVK